MSTSISSIWSNNYTIVLSCTRLRSNSSAGFPYDLYPSYLLFILLFLIRWIYPSSKCGAKLLLFKVRLHIWILMDSLLSRILSLRWHRYSKKQLRWSRDMMWELRMLEKILATARRILSQSCWLLLPMSQQNLKSLFSDRNIIRELQEKQDDVSGVDFRTYHEENLHTVVQYPDPIIKTHKLIWARILLFVAE